MTCQVLARRLCHFSDTNFYLTVIFFRHPVEIVNRKKETKKIMAGVTQRFFRSPTPTILWRRLGGDSFGVKVRHTSFGQEIVVPNIELSDAGDYQCSASNSVSDYEVSQIFNVRVECESPRLLDVAPFTAVTLLSARKHNLLTKSF